MEKAFEPVRHSLSLSLLSRTLVSDAWLPFVGEREQGYDPAIDLTTTKTRRTHLHRRSSDAEGDDKGEEGHIVREEQEIVDRIVRGEESGSYFMLMGSKVRSFSSLTFFFPLLFKALT